MGGCAADGVNGRVVLGQQIVTDDFTELTVEAFGEFSGGGGQMLRHHVGGRGIDQVAHQGRPFGEMTHAIDQRLVVDHQGGVRRRVLLVTIKAVSAEQPAEGAAFQHHRIGVGQLIATGRQAVDQVAEQPGRLTRFHHQYHLSQSAVGAGQQGVAGRLEAAGVKPGARLGGPGGEPAVVIGLVDQGEEGAGLSGFQQGGGGRHRESLSLRIRLHL